MRRRIGSVAAAMGLAVSLMPLEADPAEAGRIRIIRIRPHWSSGSASSSADKADERVKAKTGVPRAAAAAGRARAALEAEKAKPGPVLANPQRLVPGNTTDYANGVTCLAGC